jgi:transcriptional regulator with XRE-family HTH domain
MNVTILRFFSLIADVLLRLRHERGESQVAVARRSGMSDTQISKYERGQVMPNLPTLLQLLGAYEQHLVVMPKAIAETMPERDRVVAAATMWFAADVDDRAKFLAAEQRLRAAVVELVAAELRHRGGAR